MSFYIILSTGESGPHSYSEISELIRAGKISSNTLAREDSVSEWKPISSLESIIHFFTPPPIPTNKSPYITATRPLEYASFIDRFSASQLDGFIAFFLFMIGAFFMSGWSVVHFGLTTHVILKALIYCFIIIPWPYYAALQSSPLKSTFGMRCMNLRILDEHGNRIGFFRASLRYFAMLLVFPFFFTMFRSPRKQMLHDIICRTIVIKKTKVSSS